MYRLFRSLMLGLFFSLPSLTLMAQSVERASALKHRGTLRDSQPLGVLTKEQLDRRLAPTGLKARNGVRLYRIVYGTVTPNRAQEALDVSALVVVPEVNSPIFPWVSIQHFTILGDREAPTVAPFEGLLEASQGFVAVVPDFIGYGASNDILHPYLFAQAYVDNGIDTLRAVRAFAEAQELTLGPLFLKGYSEGGYATLALQEALETRYAGEFPLKGSAPTAGPYDLTGFRQAFAQDQIGSIYINFLILSYATWLKPLRLDRIFALDTAFVESLYDGSLVFDEILPQLPTKTTEVFEPRFVRDLNSKKPKSYEARTFIKLLADNTLPRGRWAPRTPTRFFHCADDEVVPADVARVTAGRLLDTDPAAPVTLDIITIPDPANPFRHGSCPAFYTPVAWFAQLLQARTPQTTVP
jgi:pimeloyl-ACP methyl ester carboxylesterase